MMTKYLLVGVLVWSASVSAQWRYYKAASEVVVSGTSVSLFVLADVRAGGGHVQATQATCSLTGANIRVTFDGTVPTTNLGAVLVPGMYVLTGTDVLIQARGIRAGATDGAWSCGLVGQ